MIRKLAAALSVATLVLAPAAFASTAVTSDDGHTHILSSMSYADYESDLSRWIGRAPKGASVRLETDTWTSFGRPVAESLRARPDLKFTLDYKTQGDACVAPVSRNEMVGTLSSPEGTASFPVLCLAFAHDETDVLSRWKPKDHAALAKMSPSEREYYMRTLRKEDRIRRDIIAAASAQGGKMFKLGFRLKSPSSTYEKIYLRERKDPINTIMDLVRYTVLFDTENYTEGVKKMMKELSARGYELGTLWNAWKELKLSYRGINTVLCDKTNQFIELQIHTPQSAQAADKTHVMYEQRRLLPEGSAEWKRLNDQAMEVTNTIPVPEGVTQFDTFNRPFNAAKFLKEREARGNRAPTLQ